MNSVVKQIEIRSFPPELERRNTLLAELDELLKTAKTERRALTNKEQASFDSLKGEIEKIDAKLNKEDSKYKFESRGFTASEQEEIRSFVNYVKTGQFEGRDLSSGASGAVIPKTVETMVIEKIKELAPIFERMTHYNVTGNLSIPSYAWDAHTTAFVDDFGTIAASGGTFLTVDLEAHALASLALIGKNLINRTDVPVIDIIVRQIAMSIANFLNDQIINNTGVRFSGTLRSVTQTQTATGATVTLADLISLQMRVPSVFQEESAWLMHPDTYLAIRSLVDADGRPLLVSNNQSVADDMGFNLLGKRVMLDENMGRVGAGARSIYYGDFSGLVCNQNAPISTQILLERYVDINATGVITTMDLDVSLAQPRAIAVLVHP
jgi:HK97 family phage major capsid protein